MKVFKVFSKFDQSLGGLLGFFPCKSSLQRTDLGFCGDGGEEEKWRVEATTTASFS